MLHAVDVVIYEADVLDTSGTVPLPQHAHSAKAVGHTVPQKRSADTLDVDTDIQNSPSKKARLVLTNKYVATS